MVKLTIDHDDADSLILRMFSYFLTVVIDKIFQKKREKSVIFTLESLIIEQLDLL